MLQSVKGRKVVIAIFWRYENQVIESRISLYKIFKIKLNQGFLRRNFLHYSGRYGGMHEERSGFSAYPVERRLLRGEGLAQRGSHTHRLLHRRRPRQVPLARPGGFRQAYRKS